MMDLQGTDFALNILCLRILNISVLLFPNPKSKIGLGIFSSRSQERLT
jgi:hypothetical protein